MVRERVSLYEAYGIPRRRTSFISQEEEYDLIVRIQVNPHDVEAQERLLKAHLLFVGRKAHAIARKMLQESVTISIEDLIQVGCITLLESVQDFDLRRNLRLLTFAGFRIWRDMLNYVLTYDALIEVPAHVQNALYVASKQKSNDAPLEENKLNENEILQAAKRTKRVVSLNRPLDDASANDESQTLSDLLPDTNESPLDKTEQRVFRQVFDELLETLLSEKERRVMTLLYGLDEAIGSCSLDEVAHQEHMTRERVLVIDRQVRYRLARSEDIQQLHASL